MTQIFFQVAASVVLGYLTDYFGIEDPTAEDTRDAYLYALGNRSSCCELSIHFLSHDPLGLTLIAFLVSILHGHAFLAAYKIGMHSRITLTAAIFQKVGHDTVDSFNNYTQRNTDWLF